MGAVAVKESDRGLCNLGSSALDGEVLDLAHLSRYTLGDEGLQREILDLFRAQIDSSLANLREAAASNDEKSWRMAAHTLKGSARAVGAFRLGSAAEVGERFGASIQGRTHALGAIAIAAEETCAAID